MGTRRGAGGPPDPAQLGQGLKIINGMKNGGNGLSSSSSKLAPAVAKAKAASSSITTRPGWYPETTLPAEDEEIYRSHFGGEERDHQIAVNITRRIDNASMSSVSSQSQQKNPPDHPPVSAMVKKFYDVLRKILGSDLVKVTGVTGVKNEKGEKGEDGKEGGKEKGGKGGKEKTAIVNFFRKAPHQPDEEGSKEQQPQPQSGVNATVLMEHPRLTGFFKEI